MKNASLNPPAAPRWPARQVGARTLASSLRRLPLTVLCGPLGAERANALRDGVMPLLQRRASDSPIAFDTGDAVVLPFPDRRRPAPGADHADAAEAAADRPAIEVAVLLDNWLGEPIADLHTRLGALLCIAPLRVAAAGDTLPQRLQALIDRFGVRLLLIFDRFEDVLRAADAAAGPCRGFIDELAALLNAPQPSAHVLLSVADDARPLLDRFCQRVAAADGQWVRLSADGAATAAASAAGGPQAATAARQPRAAAVGEPSSQPAVRLVSPSSAAAVGAERGWPVGAAPSAAASASAVATDKDWTSSIESILARIAGKASQSRDRPTAVPDVKLHGLFGADDEPTRPLVFTYETAGRSAGTAGEQPAADADGGADGATDRPAGPLPVAKPTAAGPKRPDVEPLPPVLPAEHRHDGAPPRSAVDVTTPPTAGPGPTPAAVAAAARVDRGRLDAPVSGEQPTPPAPARDRGAPELPTAATVQAASNAENVSAAVAHSVAVPQPPSNARDLPAAVPVAAFAPQPPAASENLSAAAAPEAVFAPQSPSNADELPMAATSAVFAQQASSNVEQAPGAVPPTAPAPQPSSESEDASADAPTASFTSQSTANVEEAHPAVPTTASAPPSLDSADVSADVPTAVLPSQPTADADAVGAGSPTAATLAPRTGDDRDADPTAADVPHPDAHSLPAEAERVTRAAGQFAVHPVAAATGPATPVAKRAWAAAAVAAGLLAWLVWPSSADRGAEVPPLAAVTPSPRAGPATTPAAAPPTAPAAAASGDPATPSGSLATLPPTAAGRPSAPTTVATLPTLALAIDGDDGGAARLAGDLAQLVARPAGVDLKVEPASGWADALAAPRDGQRLAIVRYDALAAMRRESPGAGVRLVTPLVSEELYFITRADAPLKHVHDIERASRINVGPAQGGRAVTAQTAYQRLFDHPMLAGQASFANRDTALRELLEARGVDVMVVVDPQPSAWLGRLTAAQRSAIKVLPLAPQHPSTQRAHRTYLPAVLHAGSGSAPVASETPTLSVMSFLVATGEPVAAADSASVKVSDDAVPRTPSADPANGLIARVASGLCRNLDSLRREGHPKWQELQPGLALPAGWPYAVSATAAFRGCAGSASAAATALSSSPAAPADPRPDSPAGSASPAPVTPSPDRRTNLRGAST